MNLKLLPADGDLVRLEASDTMTRNSAAAGHDPLTDLCGSDIYSHQVLLSLSRTMYVDSSGVEWLIHCHRRFQEHGGRLVMHSLTPTAQQLLKMMRLDRVLEVEANEAAAHHRICSPRTIEPHNSPRPNGDATNASAATEAQDKHEHP